MSPSYRLLICSVIAPTEWCLYDENWEIVDTENFEIRGKEFDFFLSIFHSFIQKNGITVESIDIIYNVSGPASFTG